MNKRYSITVNHLLIYDSLSTNSLVLAQKMMTALAQAIGVEVFIHDITRGEIVESSNDTVSKTHE